MLYIKLGLKNISILLEIFGYTVGDTMYVEMAAILPRFGELRIGSPSNHASNLGHDRLWTNTR